jgi:hypothetical protein
VQFLPEALLGSVFYAIGCVPFAVWAGLVTRRGAASGSSGYPGHGATFWFLFLPLALFITGLVRGFDTSDPATPYLTDEWGQVLTLLTVPAAGWLFGYVVGVIVGSSERDRV